MKRSASKSYLGLGAECLDCVTKGSRQKASRQKAATCATKYPRLNSCDIRPPRQKAAEKNMKKVKIYQQVFDDFFQLYMGIVSCIGILAWNPLR